jgi:hypothetical protein
MIVSISDEVKIRRKRHTADEFPCEYEIIQVINNQTDEIYEYSPMCPRFKYKNVQFVSLSISVHAVDLGTSYNVSKFIFCLFKSIFLKYRKWRPAKYGVRKKLN